jgi:hypothetical protein
MSRFTLLPFAFVSPRSGARGDSAAHPFTPKGLNIKAQGRAAHPG